MGGCMGRFGDPFGMSTGAWACVNPKGALWMSASSFTRQRG